MRLRRKRRAARPRLRTRIFRRLFVKIYLTIIACLLAVAVASGLYWRSALDQADLGFADRRDRFVAEMLPPGLPADEVQDTIDRLSRAIGADIAVYGRDGALIAAAGKPPPPPPRPERRRDRDRDDDDEWGDGHDFPFAARLADGRVVAARFDRPWRVPGRSPFVYLLLIAGVIGIAAYPVVRHLTRRLETLRRGVDSFGEGELSARVAVEGRDEVAAVARSFNAAAARIEDLVAAHRALLANASHELRSPVARLRMAVDLSEPGSQTHAEIVRNLEEIDELVEEILLASRLDHGGRKDERETLDLLALAAEEGARQGVEVDGEPAEMVGDPRLMARLVRNLMINGLKHGRPPVSAQVHLSGGSVILTVRDRGPGIPDGEQERIFEPFYRPAGRGEGAGGWGLGLALVRQIAERHGGSVRVETPQDGGARFVVELPSASRPARSARRRPPE